MSRGALGEEAEAEDAGKLHLDLQANGGWTVVRMKEVFLLDFIGPSSTAKPKLVLDA